MFVGQKRSSSKQTHLIEQDAYRATLARFSRRFLARSRGSRRLARLMGSPVSSLRILLGHEDFDFPASKRLLEQVDFVPDVLHLHNLHGGYFDLRALPYLSRAMPTFVTLHDAWMLSGHCSFSLECERWKSGCGNCPDLGIYPSVFRDATAYNWRRKREIYQRCKLHIAAPSKWLMDKVLGSMLLPAASSHRIVPHGVDLSVFKPADKAKIRHELGLPLDKSILIFAAKGIKSNQAKDYGALKSAFERISEVRKSASVLFLALGESDSSQAIGKNELRFLEHVSDRAVVAKYFQAADIYVHATKTESWGLSITEAMACGLPAVATNVGGIPDQVLDGVNGFLAASGSANALADRLLFLMENPDVRAKMGMTAQEMAARLFNRGRMTKQYLDWYEEVLRLWRGSSHG